MTPGFDIRQVLNDVARAVWLDLPAIMLSGLLTVAIPIGCSFWFGSGGSADVLIILAQGFAACLFGAIVAHGVIARRRGSPLPPAEFVLRGLRASQPGVNIGLVLASVLMIAPIALTLTDALGLGDVAALLVRVAAIAAATAVIVRYLPVIAVAVAERLGPVGAMGQAAALTAGHRVSLMFVTAVVGWAAVLVPAVVGVVVFGSDTETARAVLGELRGGWFDVRVWLLMLAITLGGGIAAVLPPVVYLALREG